MALTLVATAGAANANSYATRAEGDEYHERVLSARVSDWDGADDLTKDEALVMATRVLDDMWYWYGRPDTSTQALAWPRAGLLDRHEWDALDETTVPQEIKDATAELARQLISGDRTADNSIETKGVTSMRAGPVSFTFKNGVKAKVMPDAVSWIIPRHWGRLKGSGLTRPGVR
jgi:hypothetical protein